MVMWGGIFLFSSVYIHSSLKNNFVFLYSLQSPIKNPYPHLPVGWSECVFIHYLPEFELFLLFGICFFLYFFLYFDQRANFFFVLWVWFYIISVYKRETERDSFFCYTYHFTLYPCGWMYKSLLSRGWWWW